MDTTSAPPTLRLPRNEVIDLVDSTCIYEVLEVLNASRPEQCHSWAWHSCVEVSCSLLDVENLAMAPSPDLRSAPSGAFGRLIQSLSDVVVTAESR
jgi:hypothetical protein